MYVLTLSLCFALACHENHKILFQLPSSKENHCAGVLKMSNVSRFSIIKTEGKLSTSYKTKLMKNERVTKTKAINK